MGNQPESLTFVVSDIHGRLDLLDQCLHAIRNRASSGRVIFTGDYIDRGPQSAAVVQRLIDGPPAGFTWEFIRGNHEDFMVDACNGGDPSCWLANGGVETMQSYAMDIIPAHVDWMEALPRLLWDDLRVYTHAGVDEGFPLENQPEAITQWFRYPKGANVGYNGRHVVHGHTPQKNGPELFENRTNLDTGGFYTGKMAVGVFNNVVAKPIEIIYVDINTT